MSVLTYAQIEALMYDDLNINVATDAPLTTGVTNDSGRFINDAYATIWEMSGGRLRKVPSSAAWTAAQLAAGILHGVLTDIGDLLHVFATATAPQALATATTADVNLTSAALFGSVVPGMHISGTGILANTYVESVTDSSNLVMTRAASDSTSDTRTFSPTTGIIELDPVELSRIHWLRSNTTVGTYGTPQVYAKSLAASPGLLDVGKVTVDYWPGTTGFYFPIHYVPQFAPLDGTITTPDVNDLEARDIAHLAALGLAPLVGRSELAPMIALKISERTRLALERRSRAAIDARQDS